MQFDPSVPMYFFTSCYNDMKYHPPTSLLEGYSAITPTARDLLVIVILVALYACT